jgi:hypothetical protein
MAITLTVLFANSTNAQNLTGDPNVTVTTGTSGVFKIINSGTDLLRVHSDGSIRIGTGTVPDPTIKLSIGGSGQVFGVDNSSTFAARNSSGVYENWLTARHTDNVMYLNYGSGGFNIRNASDLTSMFMDNTGNVSVGSASHFGPRLDVFGVARFGYGFGTMPPPVYGGIQIGEYGSGGHGELQFLTGTFSNGYGFRFRGSGTGALLLERRWASGTFSNFMSFTDSGVGIGSDTPIGNLQIGSMYPARFVDSTLSGVPNGIVLDMAVNSEIHIGGLRIGKTAMPVIETWTGASGQSPLLLNPSSDNDVVIGNAGYTQRGLKVLSTGLSTFAGSVSVTGNVSATGTIYANFQDVAEWVPAAGSLPAGTVVVISGDTNNTVKAATRAYDTGVAGVVSPSPGLLLGVEGPLKAKIATTGRVKVRVDATSHPIRIGDLLVTSDKPGLAMFSEPLDLGGIKIHRPGTLIGKALEPLASGQGEVLVLLSLQ